MATASPASAGAPTLYDFRPSGNGHKIRLLLKLTGQPYQYVDVDILARQSRTPAYLALNPFGKIPLLALPDGRCMAESNAILFHLAQDTGFWPADAWAQANVLRWMFFEQYSHEPNIAVLRSWRLHKPDAMGDQAAIIAKQAGGAAALAHIEQGLTEAGWLVGGGPTIADLCLYPYSKLAPEAGFDLTPYPKLMAWLAAIEALPGYAPITEA